jgi:hypothetical protein
MMSTAEYKARESLSSNSDSSKEDSSSIQNYNTLLEKQFFGGDEALNEMNLS